MCTTQSTEIQIRFKRSLGNIRHDFYTLADAYDELVAENEKLRKENEQLRKSTIDILTTNIERISEASNV